MADRPVDAPIASQVSLAEQYHALLKSDGQLARATYERLVESHDQQRIIFQDRLLCKVLRPRFLSSGQLEHISTISSILAGLIERIGEEILRSDELLTIMGATDEERDIWQVDPGYPGLTLTSRLDSFLVDDQPRFVEYNAESPAGIAYSDSLSEIFLQLPVMNRWTDATGLQRFHGRRRLLETLIWAYRTWGGKGTPTIAVIDWQDVVTRRDFELCAEYFREHGIRSIIVDPRALEYRSGKLWHENDVITLVYRRVLLHELLDKADEAQSLFDAYRDGAVCMVNSPRSKLIHKKGIFALLGDDLLDWKMTAEERSVVADTIPWTRLVRDGATTYDGLPVDFERFVTGERERLVLKPVDDYGGHGVVLGWEVTDTQWQEAIAHALDAGYVVQERVPIARTPYPVWDEQEVAFIPMLEDTDPLLFRGEVGSILTRLSQHALLNVSAGTGSTTATFVAQGKDEE